MPKRSRKWRSQEAGPGRRANQREWRQLELDRAGGRPLPDHDVELEILEGRVKDFLDDRAQAVNLVDKKHVARLQVGQDRREVAGTLQHGAGGLPQVDA